MTDFEEKAKREFLNKAAASGFPLQRYCSHLLSQGGWRIDEEFSVSMKGPNGVSERVEETTGDVHAQKQIGRAQIHLVIECKRKLGVIWGFFRDLDPRASAYLPEVVVTEKGVRQYYATLPFASWTSEMSSHSVGWEITANQANESKNEVRGAAIQAWTSLLSVLKQSKKDLDMVTNDLPNLVPYEREVFIPVVVTGAELVELKPDFERYDVMNLKGSLDSAPFLNFRPGIPSYLSCPVETPLSPIEDIDSISRPDVAVVNYSRLVDFIIALTDTITKSEKKMYEDPEFLGMV